MQGIADRVAGAIEAGAMRVVSALRSLNCQRFFDRCFGWICGMVNASASCVREEDFCARQFFVIGRFSLGFFSRLTQDRKSTRLNSSHVAISYAVFCLK